MKADNNPTSIRWDKEAKELGLKQFFLDRVNDTGNSLSSEILDVLKGYKKAYDRYELEIKFAKSALEMKFTKLSDDQVRDFLNLPVCEEPQLKGILHLTESKKESK